MYGVYPSTIVSTILKLNSQFTKLQLNYSCYFLSTGQTVLRQRMVQVISNTRLQAYMCTHDSSPYVIKRHS